jgi:hypothetical protein
LLPHAPILGSCEIKWKIPNVLAAVLWGLLHLEPPPADGSTGHVNESATLRPSGLFVLSDKKNEFDSDELLPKLGEPANCKIPSSDNSRDLISSAICRSRRDAR